MHSKKRKYLHRNKRQINVIMWVLMILVILVKFVTCMVRGKMLASIPNFYTSKVCLLNFSCLNLMKELYLCTLYLFSIYFYQDYSIKHISVCMQISNQIKGFLFTWVLERRKRLIYSFLRKSVLHDLRHRSLGDIPLGFRGMSFFLLAGEGSNMFI